MFYPQLYEISNPKILRSDQKTLATSILSTLQQVVGTIMSPRHAPWATSQHPGRAERPEWRSEEELRHDDDDELVGRAANVDLSCVHDHPEQGGSWRAPLTWGGRRRARRRRERAQLSRTCDRTLSEEWVSEGGEANPAAQLEVHYKWEESYFPCQDDNPKKKLQNIGCKYHWSEMRLQIGRNPVRKLCDKYETAPARKYDCKLREIQLENGVLKKWTNWRGS